MKTTLRFSAAARRDIADAMDWYAEQPALDLDLRFEEEVYETARRIERFPTSYAVVRQDVRKTSLHRFPYAIFYRQRDDELLAVAVLHHAQHPSIWQRRH